MSLTEDAPLTLPADGRLARSARTRDAVIDALLSLHEEGDLAPALQRVADRAGVALRTVYGHFADTEALYAETADRQYSRMLARSHDISPDLPWAQRLAALADARATVLEWMLPVSRAGALKEHDSPVLQASRARFVLAGDAQVRQVLRPELGPLSQQERLRVCDLVHVVAGGPAWEALRLDRGLDPVAAAERLSAMLRAVLTDVLTSPTTWSPECRSCAPPASTARPAP